VKRAPIRNIAMTSSSAPSEGRVLSLFLAISWILDIGIGVFFVAVGLFHLNSSSQGTTDYPKIALSLGLLILGALTCLTGIFRFPLVDVYCRCAHRYFGKGLVNFIGSAIALALESPNQSTLSWRGVIAIIVTAVACCFLLLSLMTCRGSNPRPLVYCGESTKSEEEVQPRHARSAVFNPPPEPHPSYLLPVSSAAASATRPAPQSRPKYGQENPFAGQ
jgi:hypothetical protein